MKHVSTVLSLLFLLGACTTPGGNRLTPQQQLQISCDGVATTVRVLAGYRAAGKLSASQIETVESLRPTTIALCNGSVTDYQSALLVMSNSAFRLLTIRTEVGE